MAGLSLESAVWGIPKLQSANMLEQHCTLWDRLQPRYARWRHQNWHTSDSLSRYITTHIPEFYPVRRGLRTGSGIPTIFTHTTLEHFSHCVVSALRYSSHDQVDCWASVALLLGILSLWEVPRSTTATTALLSFMDGRTIQTYQGVATKLTTLLASPFTGLPSLQNKGQTLELVKDLINLRLRGSRDFNFRLVLAGTAPPHAQVCRSGLLQQRFHFLGTCYRADQRNCCQLPNVNLQQGVTPATSCFIA